MRNLHFGLFICALLGASGCSTHAGATSAPAGAAVRCAAGTDTDRDGLSDACELAFARAFAPLLRTAPGACVPGGTGAAELPPGGYLFGVRPLDGDTIRIVYLPAYHADCGWRGVKCSLPLVSCSGHAGDSELIGLTVTRGGPRWQTVAVFLSAHCFGASATRCRWYVGRALHEFTWAGAPRAAPIIWVAEGKNANYPSRAACDIGHWLLDSCDRNDVAARYPVAATRNIGSAAHPIGGNGCIARPDVDSSESVKPDPRGGAALDRADPVECFWSDVPFTGWQQSTAGAATPYVRYLRMVFEDAACASSRATTTCSEER